MEFRRVTVDVNRSEIVEAFHNGRELLLSGEIPHLKQLIRLALLIEAGKIARNHIPKNSPAAEVKCNGE